MPVGRPAGGGMPGPSLLLQASSGALAGAALARAGVPSSSEQRISARESARRATSRLTRPGAESVRRDQKDTHGARRAMGSLGELERALREAEEVAVDHGLAGVDGVHARTERDEEGYEVIDRRMRVRETGRAVLVVDERVDVALRDLLRGPVIELLRPGRRRRIRTEVAQERQPVGHEPRSDD